MIGFVEDNKIISGTGMKNKIQNTSGYQGLQKGRQLLPVLDH
jgi:hypothetical protein